MYDQLSIMIKLRYAELLAEAETARLLKTAKANILARAEQIQRLADKENAPDVNYTVAVGQGEAVFKIPHTDKLLQAAKSESQDTDDLGEVIFFKKSVF